MRFTPYAVLKNTTAQPLTVTPALNYMPGGSPVTLPLPVQQLKPQETRRLDLPSMLAKLGLGGFNGDANLTFSITGHGGDLMIATGSVDQTGNFVFPVPAEAIGQSFGKSIGHWTVANGVDTMYSLWNPTNSAQDFVVTLHYGDGSGQYVLPLHLAAQDSTAIDIAMLIAMRQPDANGNLIPDYIQEGSVVFSNPKGRTQWMTLAVCGAFYNPRKATCGDYCVDCYGYEDFLVFADPYSVAVGGTVQLNAQGTYADGSVDDFTTSSSWSSNSNSAQVGANTGVVTGVSPGSVQISAQLPALIDITEQICALVGGISCPMVIYDAASSGSSVSVAVTSVNLSSDQVSVTLSGPSGASGQLVVTWNGPSGSANIASATEGPGTYTFNPSLSGLASGQYTGVNAQWTVNGTAATGSYSTSFYVLGTYAQSQYNTPAESQCPVGNGPAFITAVPNNCYWNAVSMRSKFISQTWLNGSGNSDVSGYGLLQEYTTCSAPSGANQNYFQEVSSITPACGGSLSNSTVAWPSSNNNNLGCGDQVLIVGLGSGTGTVKTVNDKCPGCVAADLDNYNTSNACSLTGLGSFQTIRLNR